MSGKNPLIILSIFISFLIFQSTSVFSQDNEGTDQRKKNAYTPPKDNKFSWDKFFVGGNLGAQFGTETFVNIAPIVGYRIIPRLSVGIGGTYQFYRINYDFFKYKTHIYGGNIFSQVIIWDNLFAHVEYELINRGLVTYNSASGSYDEVGRVNVDGLLLGAGYGLRMGDRAVFNLMVLFNVLEDEYSIYNNPIIRMGIAVGL
jgi:hypothetical protein